MTRETKVGLIVAGSFLCLVCIVVASKLRHGDDPASGATEESSVSQVAAVKPMQNTNAPEAKKKEGPPKNAPPSVVLPPLPERTDGAKPPMVVIPPAKSPSVPTFDPPPQPVIPNSGGNTVPPPVVNSSEASFPLVLQPQIVQAEDKTNKGVLPSPQPLPFPPSQESKAEEVKPITLEMPPVVRKSDSLLDPAKSVTKPDPVFIFPPMAKDPPSLAKDPPPPAIVQFNEKDPPNPTAKLPTAPANPMDTVLSVPTFPKDPALPVQVPLGMPIPFPKDMNAKVPSITLPVDPIKPGIALVPNDPSMPSNPVPRIPGSEMPNAPPIMARPGFANDPRSKPMPIIRDTDIHLCQPGDTNFAILSQKLYGTDKYADALLKYNRDLAQATVNGTVFLSNTPALVPGQQVHVAPVAILERDYRPFLRTANVAPVPTIPPAGPPLLSKPTPLSPAIATISNPPGAGQVRTYTVQSPNGESILDIAERVMGDRGQWHKIWRVNPSYPPHLRIPAGTKLEIPAN